jgi:hypothetical protein
MEEIKIKGSDLIILSEKEALRVEEEEIFQAIERFEFGFRVLRDGRISYKWEEDHVTPDGDHFTKEEAKVYDTLGDALQECSTEGLEDIARRVIFMRIENLRRHIFNGWAIAERAGVHYNTYLTYMRGHGPKLSNYLKIYRAVMEDLVALSEAVKMVHNQNKKDENI